MIPTRKQTKAQKSSPPHIEELLRILGDQALLLACRHQSKRPVGKWGSLTIDAMRSSAYMRSLARAGNLGVALGITSAGLVSIDIDQDDAVRPFLELNPELVDSFRTKGKRGCNIFVQILGAYPDTQILELDGKAWGEFRSHGSQTIVWGTHPEGMKYEWLTRRPPVAMAYEQIVWPPGVTPKGSKSGHCKDGNGGNEGIDGNHVVLSGCCVCPDQVSAFTLEGILELSTPTQKHTTHKQLFTLARGLKALELQSGAPLTFEQLKEAFLRWHERTPKELLNHTKDDYMLEFLACYKDVKYPLGNGNALHDAFEDARSNPYPPEADMFTDPDKKLLVALCYHLQKAAGTDPFFLSCIHAGKLLNRPWRTCAFWLNGLVVMGVLQVAEKANRMQRRSTRFRYIM